ncbi:MAG: IPT/TIG domain-containing protein, partial [Acidimicrobiales bacterium]
VAAVSPPAGSTAGGTTVTISGANLSGATAVDFGSAAASSFTVDSSTEIRTTSPSRPAGKVEVTVTTPSGTSSANPATTTNSSGVTRSTDLFNYVAPPPPERFAPKPIPPVVRVIGPSRPFQLSKYVTVTYSATDPVSAVRTYDVRYIVAAWNGEFGAYVYPPAWQHTVRSSQTLVGSPGHEFCFSVRASSAAGGVSRWSAERCTERPVASRSLSAPKLGWKRESGSAHYLGKYLKTTHDGAELRLFGVRLDQMSLVVTRCPACGNIAIYLNGTHWKTVSTYGRTTRHGVVITLPRFALRKATIALRDVSRRRRIVIESVGVSLDA